MDYENITPEDSYAPVYLVPLTENEKKDLLEIKKQSVKEIKEKENAESLKRLAMESAITKLKAIGLTEDEAKAIAGL